MDSGRMLEFLGRFWMDAWWALDGCFDGLLKGKSREKRLQGEHY